jgi:hypothetical protein
MRDATGKKTKALHTNYYIYKPSIMFSYYSFIFIFQQAQYYKKKTVSIIVNYTETNKILFKRENS